MEIEYSQISVKQIKKLPRSEQIKILRKIQKLTNDPYAGKALKGEFVGLRSLKVWPYRIIYRWLAQKKVLFINVVEHRQRAYKK